MESEDLERNENKAPTLIETCPNLSARFSDARNNQTHARCRHIRKRNENKKQKRTRRKSTRSRENGSTRMER